MNPDCSQKTIRDENLEKQLTDILENIEIPPEFHAWAIKYLKEEQSKEKQDRDNIIQAHRTSLDFCNRKIDTLFSMRFGNEIDPEEFKQKKSELMKEQSHLMDLLNDAQARVKTWLERAEKLLSFAETAKQRFEIGTLSEKKRHHPSFRLKYLFEG